MKKRFIRLFAQYWHKQTCPLCHESANQRGFCTACLADLQQHRILDAVCPFCAQKIVQGTICGYCQRYPPAIDGLYASFHYHAPISTLLHHLKYRHSLTYAGCLKSLMLEYPPPWINTIKFDAILPVPLSRHRLFFRGFNQSRELAEAVAHRHGLPILSFADVQRRHRPPQSRLSKKARLKNVRGVFRVCRNLQGKSILLIDDVVTTGATLNELAKTLKKSGAAQIFAWSLMRR